MVLLWEQHCCGSEEVLMELLRERTLLRQWGNNGRLLRGGHCCGSGEIYIVLLREQTLLRQWGNNGKAPAGAGTAAAVGENRKRS